LAIQFDVAAVYPAAARVLRIVGGRRPPLQ